MLRRVPVHGLVRFGARGLTSSAAQKTYNIIESCPEPTCSCRQGPSGLDIDYKLPLSGTAPSYTEHVLISTGKADWTSRIENDEHGVLARELKTLIGPKGKYFDPYRNIILSCSSFAISRGVPSSDTSSDSRQSSDGVSSTRQNLSATSAFLLPSFLYIPTINTNTTSADSFVQTFLAGNNKKEQDWNKLFPGTRQTKEVVVLICSHGTRDSRCGVLGPILQSEFVDQLGDAGFNVSTTVWAADYKESGSEGNASVACISHIGGHRWAGNVIIYIPSTMTSNPLAGRGIWYGRVMPEHVEGIVRATIRGGAIIQDLFRGGIEPDRTPLRP